MTDLEKTVADFEPKINKVQKQLDSVTAKGKDRKCETLTLELGKVGVSVAYVCLLTCEMTHIDK